MNCDDFQARLNRLLDQHADVSGDLALAGHADECDECSDRLRIWAQIDSAFPDVDRPQAMRKHGSSKMAMTTAAGVLFAASFAGRRSRPMPRHRRPPARSQKSKRSTLSTDHA